VSSAPILHITTAAAWAEAEARGVYTADSLATEGFIHCSDPHQVMWVAQQRFSGRSDLVILYIDPSRLRDEVRYENLEGGTELFPHVYGPIPREVVIEVVPLRVPPRPA
jgi:uncharacterized protein (DUF952 family)